MTLAMPNPDDINLHTMSFEDINALEETYSVIGYNLIPKNFLIGVPHIITGIRFQDVTRASGKQEQQRGYVTVEAVVGTEAMLYQQVSLGRVSHYMGKRVYENPSSVEELKVSPEERIVYNDGSTGVRRQAVHLLNTYGFISVDGAPHGEQDPILDIPFFEWKDQGTQLAIQGDETVPYIVRSKDGKQPFILKALRGLRCSDYDNPALPGDAAETYYWG